MTQKKLKIAMLCAEYPPKWGGVGIVGFNLSAALARRGHKVHVITRKERKKPPARPGVRLHFVRWARLPIHFILSYGRNAVRRMNRIGGFDIVHSHPPLIGLEPEEFDKITIPHVATMQGTWMMERRSLARENIRYLGINDLAIRFFGQRYEKYEKMFLDRCDRITTISRHCMGELEEYGADFSRVELLPDGVDTKDFFPADTREEMIQWVGLDPEAEKDTVFFLYVGRYAVRKGLSYLVEGMAKVRDRIASEEKSASGKDIPRIRLIMAGKPGKYLDTVRKLIKEMKLEENTTLLTDVPFDKLRMLYQGCDTLILPSTYEGQGLTILEAMSCNRPAIVSEVGGMIDMVKHGENGYLFPVGDSSALADRMIDMATSPKDRARMGAAGLKMAREVYDWDIIAARMEKVYLTAIDHFNSRKS